MEEIFVNENNFEEEVLKSEKPVLVDFFAVWCGPCKMLAPELESFALSRDDIKVCKIDVDEARSIAIKYDIEVIPTLFLFRNGNVVARRTGYMKQDEIESFVNEN